MLYKNIVPGTFLSRPNRFIAHIEIDGQDTICHVKNTGRCKELLSPGAAAEHRRAGRGGGAALHPGAPPHV